MRVHLAGHLAFYHPQKQSWVETELDSPVPLIQVLEQLGVPISEIALFVVNSEMVDPEKAIVCNQDVVQFYPPTDGG